MQIAALRATIIIQLIYESKFMYTEIKIKYFNA